MSSIGLKMFALGMNDEVQSLGRLALGTDFSSPQVGTPFVPPQQQPAAPTTEQMAPAESQMRAPSVQNKWYQGMIDRGIDPVFASGMMPNIGDESGWNTSIQEASPRAGRGGRGAYQLTGDRREEFERRYGDDYSDENQMDFLAWEVLQGPESKNYQRILKEAGGDPRKAAAGIVQHFLRPAKEHADRRMANYLGDSSISTRSYPGLPIDTSYLEEGAEDMDPEAAKRRFQGSLLMGIGQGISDISRGKTADISNVMDAYYQRQSEARDRLMEIARERRRQEEVNWNRQNEMEDRDIQLQAQAERDERLAQEQAARDERLAQAQAERDAALEQQDIRAEERGYKRTDVENEQLASTMDLLYPDSPMLAAGKAVAKRSPAIAFDFMAEQEAQRQKDIEDAQAAENNAAMADYYTQAGSEGAAQAAGIGDYVSAREIYRQETGKTDHMKDAEVLINGTPEQKEALTKILFTESGAVDPVKAGLIDNELKVLAKLDEDTLASRKSKAQMELALNLATDPNMADTDKLRELMYPAMQYLAPLGITDANQVSQETVFKAITNGIVADYQSLVNKGVATEADTKRYEDSLASLGKSKEANAAILYAKLKMNEREEAYAIARRQYLAEGGDPGDGNAQKAYIQEKMGPELTGDIFRKAADVTSVQEIPIGTPYYLVDGDTTELVIRGQE